MAKIKPRVKVPRSAEVGEVIELKTLISHPMESGQRKDKAGNPIPRKIINAFNVTYNGEEVISATLEPAVSANPYIQFMMTVPEAGEIVFAWTDDDGSVYDLKKKITVG
ncbi:thiosulfate oxidation carrier complex protein SoxZ [Rhodovulum sp. DZ06]|uniref:thiosulfate oxidation carrier complex protein SoxZ n=1 Tax=Rhodovulum sp. DZ06 TaxID=3425126 RepID=UPI003D35832B